MCYTESYFTLQQKGDKYASTSAKVFYSIFVEVPEHKKLYLVYVQSTRKVIASYDVVFDESLSIALAYMSQPYSEEMLMIPAVKYAPCATSSKEQTGNIITFSQFEEGNI